MEMAPRVLLQSALLFFAAGVAFGGVAFEKLTELDYRGTTYYTIRNLSLWECQGWCREEPECNAASFSFVMNPLAPIQETLCLLQNATEASNPSQLPQRAVSLYYMVKLSIRSDKVCKRPWTFERVPNKMLKGKDNALIFTSTKEACLKECLGERQFTCRSAEYNYVTLQCHLSEYDRRSVDEIIDMVDVSGVDYFENLCLQGEDACSGGREFDLPEFGVQPVRVAHYVDLHYYVDKELMANSAAACKRACEIENEFLCRSFLYKGPPSGNSYNCQLFHLDHKTLPDGPATYLSTDRPLLDNGEPTGTYYENVCSRSLDVSVTPAASSGSEIIGGGGGGSSSSSSTSSGAGIQTSRPDLGESSGGDGGNANCDPTGVCYEVSVHCKDTRIAVDVITNRPFNGRVYALGRSETCNIDVINSSKFQLDLTMTGQDCNTQSVGGVYTNTVVIQHHSVVMTKTDKIYKIRCTYDMSSKNITFGMMPISPGRPPSDDVSEMLTIRDPDMIPITSAPVAPSPKIRILDTELREVETVRIGDRLTFRIEIPENTPYGIFARSCVAMAKDSRSTFQIIDDDGCPVEPAIFPRFVQEDTALQSVYEAFRFTESYGVIFQCNVKYCLGPCEPAVCQIGREKEKSWGRRRRSVERQARAHGHVQETTREEAQAFQSEEEMSISQEILVLDLGDGQETQFKNEPKKPGNENYYGNDGSLPMDMYDFDKPEVTLFETCPTRSSVLALAVTCAVLLLIYVVTVFYFVMRKWLKPPKSMR